MTQPTLSLVDTDPAESAVDAIVIGLHSQPDEDGSLLPAAGAESITAAFDGKLISTLALLGATGAPGEVTKLATLGTIAAPLLVAVGLGTEPDGPAPDLETLRRGTGAAVRALAGSNTVVLALPVPDDAGAAPVLRAALEGALLGGYRFAGYKSKKAPGRRDPVAELRLHVPDAADEAAAAELRRAEIVARAVRLTRDWVNTPPNALRPADLADQVAAAATEAGLDVEVLDFEQLKAGGYGGIVAVGQGSEAPPRLVKLTYTPSGVTDPKRIALVGKGITFDTGGVSIKPAAGMWEMKSDMAGAAAVAATLIAVAELKPGVAVSGYLAIAENMPSGSAYRPGDVVTMFNGKRVEVFNTDAEGRMVLGDAMARACADGTDYLFETSTLTGGQVIALGKRISGLMGSDEATGLVEAAGTAAGEPAWRMPLPDDVRKGMESEIADICQTNANLDRAGHMLQGGVFLREFVTEGVEWAHIDIAGPSYHTGEANGYWTKGGTGVPVRTLLQVIDDLG
ncbi:leucyl aminopeptidase [Actinoplanes campanulatus]|uniref:Probable cytosol aminopeptidase n=1 Tax=Actinoplanes campanulatus TaxID=113559 RepID=A0A7W5AQA7_9ACTN|nr:leucyl aminopeptidase [Actinoplanes campanulatus]MBB3099974.1 leucyl aminopeptidase [Actinoplanes campanulatus]GGN29685.1 putative cytosol aminopeptidase [Actinoplanes campanulatus]GID42212.1 putative cytosol aminopeptidase [Actinoplanes campanulatus]